MFHKLIKNSFHLVWRFTRPMTLGVRAFVINEKRQIVLVRHTYVKGWHLPGGGVEAGETVEQAIVKELKEEANVTVLSRPQLLSFHKNLKASKRDHVALFVVLDFQAGPTPAPNREIAEVDWFDLDALPANVTPSTRKRIAEYLNGNETDAYW